MSKKGYQKMCIIVIITGLLGLFIGSILNNSTIIDFSGIVVFLTTIEIIITLFQKPKVFEKMEIENKDERNQLIWGKSAALACVIAYILITLCIAIAGFLLKNDEAIGLLFIVLLGTSISQLIAQKLYNKKM